MSRFAERGVDLWEGLATSGRSGKLREVWRTSGYLWIALRIQEALKGDMLKGGI